MVAAFPPITLRLQLKFSGIFDGNQRNPVQGPERNGPESTGAADTQKHQQALETHFTSQSIALEQPRLIYLT